MKIQKLIIVSFAILTTAVANGQSKVTINYDWQNKKYTVSTDGTDGPGLIRTKEARHKANVGDDVSIRITNINTNTYGAKFKIELKPAEGRALTDAITTLLSSGFRSGDFNNVGPSTTEPWNTYRTAWSASKKTEFAWEGVEKNLKDFKESYARNAVTTLKSSVVAAVVGSKAGIVELTPESIRELRTNRLALLADARAKLETWYLSNVANNQIPEDIKERNVEEIKLLDKHAAALKLLIAGLNYAMDDENFVIESDAATLTDNDDILISTEITPKKENDAAEKPENFSDFFFAKRKLKDYSVGIAYDELVDGNYILRGSTITAGATDAHRLGLFALHHIPIGDENGKSVPAISLGAGIKTDEELRTYIGLSWYFGKDQRAVFTIGYAFGKALRLDGYEVGNNLPEGETTIPTKRVTEKKLFIGFSIRQ